MTNFERIKNMSVEEMAEIFAGCNEYNCIACIHNKIKPVISCCSKGLCKSGCVEWLNLESEE